MSSLFFETAIYLSEALISSVFLMSLLTRKQTKIGTILLWCEIVLAAMAFTPSFSMFRLVLIAAAEIVFTMLMFEGRVLKKVSALLFKWLMVGASSSASYAMYATVVDEHAPFFLSCKSDNCTYCLMYVLLFSVITSLALQFSKEKRGSEVPWVIGTLLTIGLGEVAAVLSIAVGYQGVIKADEAWLAIVATVFMVLANLSVGTLAPHLLKKLATAVNIDFGHELSDMEFKYYEMAVQNDQKLAAIRHDIANHIQTIYSLIAGGDTQRGIELIHQLKDQYTHVDRIVYCQNPVLNIILSNKKSEAEERNIETVIKIKDELDGLPIADFDLSTVICNLLDNAIRGAVCSEQSHPRLIVEILKKNQYLVIRILNSCKISMNIEGAERLESTKMKTQTHGIGMQIVSGIAKKYKGDFVATAQNGIFTATVVMSIK